MKNLIAIFFLFCVIAAQSQKRVDFGVGVAVMDASIPSNDEFKSTIGYSAHAFMDLYTGEVGFLRFGIGAIDRGFSYKNDEKQSRVFQRNPNLIALKGWAIPTSDPCKPKVMVGPSYDLHNGNPWHVSANLQLYCSWEHFEVGVDWQRSLNDAYDDSDIRYQNIGLRMNFFM